MGHYIHATDIVGYTFNADIYCPRCVTDAVTASSEYDGWALAEGVHMSTEDNLNEIAYHFGIDRRDETSFDSDGFPKVVFASMDVDDDRCGLCHESLMGE